MLHFFPPCKMHFSDFFFRLSFPHHIPSNCVNLLNLNIQGRHEAAAQEGPARHGRGQGGAQVDDRAGGQDQQRGRRELRRAQVIELEIYASPSRHHARYIASVGTCDPPSIALHAVLIPMGAQSGPGPLYTPRPSGPSIHQFWSDLLK